MNKKNAKHAPYTAKLIRTALLFVASITAFHSARADIPRTAREDLKPLVNLARSNPKESGEAIILTQRFLSGFLAVMDSSIPASEKVSQMKSRLNNLDLFLVANTRSIPRWLFDDFDREIKRTRLALSRYEMYARNPEIPGAKESGQYWAGEVRKRAVWANRIAKTLQPIVFLLKGKDSQ